jgi:hypothetical protein
MKNSLRLILFLEVYDEDESNSVCVSSDGGIGGFWADAVGGGTAAAGG